MASSTMELEKKLRAAAESEGDNAEDIVRLLDMGADIDAADEYGNGWTSLMKSSEAGKVERVNVLLVRGARVNMQNKDGSSALMMASMQGHIHCVRVLLDRGAEVNMQDNDGWTALQMASVVGKVECVKMLLDRSGQVNMQSRSGQTALMKASVAGHVKCVKMLLDRGAQVNMQDKDGWTALMMASKAETVECVKVLLDGGVQVNMQDKRGWTALMRAYDRGYMECVKMLLDRGAQINIQHKWGGTELLKASEAGKVECVKMLLHFGVQVNIQNEDGWTALMKASEAGAVECVNVLLDKGAQVNMQDKKGWTALMKSYDRGHRECVKMLLDRGAQVNTQNEWGGTELLKASEAGKVERLKLLLHFRVQVNIQNKDGWTALMKASEAGKLECVKVLLDKGAQVNMQSKDGWTSLMKASEAGKVECVKVLLDRGAQVNMQEKSGDTALHLAVRAKQVVEKNQTSCIRTLLFHPGIDIYLKNNQGRTAMRDAGYKSLRVFNQVLKTCSDFPADSYGKVVLCGNSGAGKSTLTQAIINISKPTTTRIANRFFGREDVIEPFTAGIVPHQVDSSHSNMVIYDLAGHHQYFSSHSACLEAISLDSPAIFLLLQDLRKESDVISKEVYYWSSMIDGVCHKCPQKSSVIVVGTHVDLLTSEQLTTKLDHLGSIARKAISHQTLVDIIAVNVTKIYSGDMNLFGDLLYRTNKDVLSMSPPISMMCHLMLAFLKEKLPLDMHAISLSDLLVCLEADQDKAIDPDITAVVPLLKTLSEKGLIVFIPFEDPHSSWIVLRKESILKVVNGALFAHQSLKEYAPLTSNTGIIPTANIKSTFPEYNVDMITQFMIHFEIGQAVDLSQINTNMKAEDSTCSDLLYIPALISVDRPCSATVPNNSFRWSETVKFIDQFFTPRFHHVLLYRLPIQFALPAAQITSFHSHLFHRRCDVWSRGLMWLSETGVATVVEISESFQSISITISFTNKRDPKYLELAHSVREVIKKTRQEFCPHLEVLEVVSCPPVDSSDPSSDTRVELSSLKEALLEKRTHVVDMSGKKVVAIADWEEPHLSYLVGAASDDVCQVVPPVEEYSSCQPLSEMIGQVMEKQLDEPDLPTLLNEVAAVIPGKWRVVGNLLKVPKGVLDGLERQYSPMDCFERVLTEWNSRRCSPYTWGTIIGVLQASAVGEVALANQLAAKYAPCALPRSDQRPTLAELYSITVKEEVVSIIRHVADKWKNLFVAFNFDSDGQQLKVIEQRYPNQAEECCREMFQTWLKVPGVSWSSLIFVLESCDEVVIAEHVKAYVGIDTHPKEPDLPTLLNEVATVIPGKWRVVGNLLNIPKGVLDGLERKYSSMDSFEHVLTEWNSRRCSPYTWDAIITVLKAPAIGEVALANKLAAKHGMQGASRDVQVVQPLVMDSVPARGGSNVSTDTPKAARGDRFLLPSGEKAFKMCYSELFDGITNEQADGLIAYLYGNELLTLTERDELYDAPTAQKNRQLLSTLEKHITTEPKCFYTLVEVLELNEKHAPLAKKLRDKLHKCQS